MVYEQRANNDEKRSSYEQDRITQAKQIMKPFVLRRLKSEVSYRSFFLYFGNAANSDRIGKKVSEKSKIGNFREVNRIF